MIRIPFLREGAANEPFPPVEQALEEPNGLLAAGGDLTAERLLEAYRRGIFPWFGPSDPILWWSPDPRCVLRPNEFRASRSLRRSIRRRGFELRQDTAFATVIRACAAPRDDSPGTWITEAMVLAYIRLHQLGHAHSVEVWQDDDLVGGLYGIRIGPCFFGESMFSRCTDASKAALMRLAAEPGLDLIDCQMPTEHLLSLGARTISRRIFLQLLNQYIPTTD